MPHEHVQAVQQEIQIAAPKMAANCVGYIFGYWGNFRVFTHRGLLDAAFGVCYPVHGYRDCAPCPAPDYPEVDAVAALENQMSVQCIRGFSGAGF